VVERAVIPPGRPPHVLVVGDVIDDLIVTPRGPIRPDTDTPATILPRPGGSGANQAVWLAASGAWVRFAGWVAAGDFARHTASLAAAGVDAHLAADRTRPTGTIVVIVGPDGSRTMLTDRGANLGLRPIDLPDDLLEDIDLLHVSGYALFDPDVRSAVLDLVDRARARGLPWSIDPASVGFLEDVGVEAFLAWTAGATVLLPNGAEGRLLADALRRGSAPADPFDPDDAAAVARTLTLHAPVVAMTLGGRGAMTAVRGGATVALPARTTAVVDTTGAGDAFAGAFLVHWLLGEDVAAAADAATLAAALAVARPGARPAPDPDPDPDPAHGASGTHDRTPEGA
jgi:sugar/nucleoside kinase (ribokinase family)